MPKTTVVLFIDGTKYTLMPYGHVSIEDSNVQTWVQLPLEDQLNLTRAAITRRKFVASPASSVKEHIQKTLGDEASTLAYARVYCTLEQNQRKHVLARVTTSGKRYRLHDDGSVTVDGKDNTLWQLLEPSDKHNLVFASMMRSYRKEHSGSGPADNVLNELHGFTRNVLDDPDQHQVYKNLCSSFTK